MPPLHFAVFLAVSIVVLVALLRWVLRHRPSAPSIGSVAGVSFIVVVVGMCFAKLTANHGIPWPIYYGVPALVTWLLPPLVFRMRRGEILRYELLAVTSAPAIHYVFAFLLGWSEYMPFLPSTPIWRLWGGST